MTQPSGEAPRLCLGVCTYNRGRRIAETLGPIAGMDRVGGSGGRVTRLVVVDKNSTDDTGAVVDEFAARQRASGGLSVVRVVEGTQGLAAARARLVRETDEPLIGMLDDDVLPDARWGAEVLGAFDAHPRAGLVGGKVELKWGSGPTRLALRYRSMLAHQDLGDAEHRLDGARECLVGAAMALRREALQASGWLEGRTLMGRTGESLTSGEDYELAILLRRAGWEVWYAPGAKVQHLIPAGRQTVEYLARLAHGVSLAKAHLAWMAERSPDADWAERQAQRARARAMRCRLLEWRPRLRQLRMAEHRGRVEGWERLVADLAGKRDS